MRGFIIRNSQFKHLALQVFLACMLFSSCKDDFKEFNKPEWLGESIYDMLKDGYTDDEGELHTFYFYVKLIEDVGYDEVLKRTGSKTLFVSDDDAFERFFKDNEFGVTSYDEMTIAQKNLILNSAMINNAYLIEMLSNTEGPTYGQALRHGTALSIYDSIPFESGVNLPNTKYWEPYKEKGLYVLKDATPAPMVHFLQAQMRYKNITDDDFRIINNGKEREDGNVFIYDTKVLFKDITCKNGYVNILEEVVLPADNMAEVLRKAEETKTFSHLLERYSAPYYSEAATKEFHRLNPTINDSVYVKKYFSELSANGKENIEDPFGTGQLGYLAYDPGWNSYKGNGILSFETDMGAIFSPADDVMEEFFNSGGGRFLKDRYKEWDSIPANVLDDLLRNHMKASFVASVPSKFDDIMDDAKVPMGIKKEDVRKCYVANNGVIYVMNKVYAPASYVAVVAPALISENMRIFNWALKRLQFDAYLLSMDSYYSFIIPTDDALDFYIDPVSLRKSQPEVFKFWYNTAATKETDEVKATVYAFNPETGEIGDSIRIANIKEIDDRLEDILDFHIVVGDIEDGKTYYRTKGGGQIKVSGTGTGMKISGDGNEKYNQQITVNTIYDQTKETNGRGNGKSYIINGSLQTPLQTVYKVLSEHEEFSEFYTLLLGNEEGTEEEHELYDIFYADKSYAGLDFNVKFFSTYQYTVYVPTNDAVQNAIANGLPTWKDVNAQTDIIKRKELTEKLVSFLRYHFQDNSVYIDGESKTGTYETALLNNNLGRFYTVKTESDGNALTITTNSEQNIDVLKTNNLYNLMARDYKFNNSDPSKATAIETSAFVVIHQVSDVLLYEKNQLSK